MDQLITSHHYQDLSFNSEQLFHLWSIASKTGNMSIQHDTKSNSSICHLLAGLLSFIIVSKTTEFFEEPPVAPKCCSYSSDKYLNHQPISHTCFPQHLNLGGAVPCYQVVWFWGLIFQCFLGKLASLLSVSAFTCSLPCVWSPDFQRKDLLALWSTTFWIILPLDYTPRTFFFYRFIIRIIDLNGLLCFVPLHPVKCFWI